MKTAAEAVTYGGVAGAAYDPCYHQFCDNLRGDGRDVALYDALREDYNLVGNVNTFAFDVNADAVATAVLIFAFDTSTLPAVPCRGAQRRFQGSCLTRTGNPCPSTSSMRSGARPMAFPASLDRLIAREQTGSVAAPGLTPAKLPSWAPSSIGRAADF